VTVREVRHSDTTRLRCLGEAGCVPDCDLNSALNCAAGRAPVALRVVYARTRADARVWAMQLAVVIPPADGWVRTAEWDFPNVHATRFSIRRRLSVMGVRCVHGPWARRDCAQRLEMKVVAACGASRRRARDFDRLPLARRATNRQHDPVADAHPESRYGFPNCASRADRRESCDRAPSAHL
jgi:hypothetical protein